MVSCALELKGSSKASNKIDLIEEQMSGWRHSRLELDRLICHHPLVKVEIY